MSLEGGDVSDAANHDTSDTKSTTPDIRTIPMRVRLTAQEFGLEVVMPKQDATLYAIAEADTIARSSQTEPDTLSIGRRRLFGLATALAGASALPWRAAHAQAAAPTAPIQRLSAALLATMKSGGSFETRYRALEPVIEQVFNLDAVLAASVGLFWTALADDQKSQLVAAFRRYTVSSYVANFDSYNGQTLQVAPAVRTVNPNEVLVDTQLSRSDNDPVKLDYVMRRGPAVWQAVDVLTDGSISRVAVQRSDFRELLRRGGVPALAASLTNKVANLSGGMVG
jgi:phospholipid transport system substrate-binding protein